MLAQAKELVMTKQEFSSPKMLIGRGEGRSMVPSIKFLCVLTQISLVYQHEDEIYYCHISL